MGDDRVIHLLAPSIIPTSSSIIPNFYPICDTCGYTPAMGGCLVQTCLNCFLAGEKLEIMNYEGFNFNLLQPKPPYPAKPAQEVVDTAFTLLREGFGIYDLYSNNCEHFATYCKTGHAVSMQVELLMRML